MNGQRTTAIATAVEREKSGAYIRKAGRKYLSRTERERSERKENDQS
jgi:hypothetical protein